MSRKTIVLLLVLLGAAVAGPSFAEPVCPDDNKRWEQCMEDLLNALKIVHAGGNSEDAHSAAVRISSEAAADESKEKAAGDEKVEETSLDALLGGTALSELNVDDFLSSFLALLDIDGLEDGEEGLKFKKNLPMAFGTLALNLRASSGELFPELKMKLGEAELEDMIEELDKERGDFDDVEVSFSFSVNRSGDGKGIWWGRDFRDKNGKATGYDDVAAMLFANISNELIGKPEAITGAFKSFNDALVVDKQVHPTGPTNWSDLSIGDTGKASPEARNKIEGTLKKLVEATRIEFESLNEALRKREYFKFGQLVANQPQFVLNVGRTFRDELVGRDGLTASIKYEMGQANVNGLRRECPGLTPKCYADFIADKDGALKRNWRASLEGSYTWTDDYSYPDADGATLLELDEAQGWDVSFSAGRSLRLDEEGMEITRFDFEAKYEDATGDTEKQGRLVSTANFTQKVSETMSLAIGLVYANRPEYRGDVNEELSARAGIKIGLSQLKKEK